MRRKLSGARLIINEIALIQLYVRMAGLPETDQRMILGKHARSIISDCPTYHIEREIGLRIEQQDRAIEENEFRDMQAFCPVVAYADIIVAENMLSSLATQSGLHKKYKTLITTNLTDVPDALRER